MDQRAVTVQITGHLRRVIKRSPLGRLLRRRHLYCVGLPKAGTESVAKLFGKAFRSAHEPQYRETIELACAAGEHRLAPEDVRRALLSRDRDLRLDVEASHVLARFCPELVEIFPAAKFILTVRQPLSWLDSEINQCINYPRSNAAAGFAPWIRLRDLNYGPPPDSRPEQEGALAQFGLHSLDGFLSYWARHIDAVLDAVPASRLLIVPVESLSRQVSTIARFAQVRDRQLAHDLAHSHRAPVRHDVLLQIPPEYLRAKVDAHCGRLVARLYTA